MTVRGNGVVDLSANTRHHVATLFEERDRTAAEELLVRECAENLPLWVDASEAGLERVRFAALRVSGGNLDRLKEAIDLANTDWRDVLVAAGFANDPRAHERWQPQPFGPSVVDRWTLGETLPTVLFRVNQPVTVIAGPRRGQIGAITALIAIEPEPKYRVQVTRGEPFDAFQRWLKAVPCD